MQNIRTKGLLLSGRIVFSDGSARQRYVLVRDGKIKWISRSRPPRALTRNTIKIVTGPQDWVFPGLIDLHTHASYNILPLWDSEKAPFNHRHEWRNDPGYKAAINGTRKAIKALKIPGQQKAQAIFSELQAIAGGTVVLDQSNRLESNASEDGLVLCRDTGKATDLGLDPKTKVRSVVDFFKPKNGKPHPVGSQWGKPPPIKLYAKERDAGTLAGLFVHLAEGRSGFGSDRGVDPYSRMEFEAFMALDEMKDPEKVRRVPMALVHGCGIDVANPDHIKFLVERDISVIWSPASNMLLYDDTIDARSLIEAGINVTLGSDWSPSGSKHVWEEAKFARHFFDAIGSTISDADIFRMVTANASRVLDIPKLGCLEEGAFADFFILRSPIESDNPLEVFFSTTDRDVLATIIAGRPIYGRRSFIEQFGFELQGLPAREGSAVKDKAVHLPGRLNIDFANKLDEIEDAMKALKPKVRRSNLLVSSDKLYQRRMQTLNARVDRFGWSVRQWKRRRTKGVETTPGRVPVPPNSVRVWCGFMAGDDYDDFLRQLGAIFMPCTVQLMGPLGLSAYFPAVPPKNRPATCPDEVAIVFYEYESNKRKSAYKTVKEKVAGRVYALLHWPVFRFGQKGSWSKFPKKFEGTLQAGTAYHLFDDAIDWYVGETRVFMGVRKSGQTAEQFLDSVKAVLDSLKANPPDNLDGALVAITEDYVVFWDHRDEDQTGDDAHLKELAQHCRRVMQKTAKDANSHASLYEKWPGVRVRAGDCLRLIFQRRGLFPW